MPAKNLLLVLAGIVVFCPSAKIHADKKIATDDSATECIQCQTLVNWYRDTDRAFEVAKQQKKPVFVFHLSGNFLKKEFT